MTVTASQLRQVVAYEVDCTACGNPLTDPEWESPYLFRPETDGDLPRLSDYLGHDDDGTLLLDTGEYIHDDPGTCWHWCHDSDTQGKGPAETCPEKDTHEEGLYQ